MKRVAITAEIENLIKASFGADADLQSFVIFEAIALNTLPLRKKHPLYSGAIADRSFLQDIEAALQAESRPVHIQHQNSTGLPIGRVFHGEYIDLGTNAEVRVLFTIDATEAEAIAKIESGTVDQVSVSVLPKHLYNSVSGFDYLGPKGTFETFYTGADPEGNTIGKNGVFARMVGLESFFEMSLVGQGGAQDARILRRDESTFGSSFQKLAASGMDPNAIVLVAEIKADEMDLTALIAQLTDAKASLTLANTATETQTTLVATLTASNADLAAQITALGEPAVALAAKTAEVETLTADLSSATVALQGVAKKLLVASGDITAETPATVAELTALIDNTSNALVAALVLGGRSNPADGDSTTKLTSGADNSAFRIRK